MLTRVGRTFGADNNDPTDLLRDAEPAAFDAKRKVAEELSGQGSSRIRTRARGDDDRI